MGIEPTTFDWFLDECADPAATSGVCEHFFYGHKAMNNVRAVTGVRRTRNGRLAINRLSRTAKPRWRMILLDGQWYDRDLLRAMAADARRNGFRIPHSMRALTAAELGDVTDPEPWTLLPPRLLAPRRVAVNDNNRRSRR